MNVFVNRNVDLFLTCYFVTRKHFEDAYRKIIVIYLSIYIYIYTCRHCLTTYDNTTPPPTNEVNNDKILDAFGRSVNHEINTFPLFFEYMYIYIRSAPFLPTVWQRPISSRVRGDGAVPVTVDFVEPSILLLLLFFFSPSRSLSPSHFIPFSFFSFPLSSGFNDSGWLMRVIHHLRECHQLPRIHRHPSPRRRRRNWRLMQIHYRYVLGGDGGGRRQRTPATATCPPTAHPSNPAPPPRSRAPLPRARIRTTARATAERKISYGSSMIQRILCVIYSRRPFSVLSKTWRLTSPHRDGRRRRDGRPIRASSTNPSKRSEVRSPFFFYPLVFWRCFCVAGSNIICAPNPTWPNLGGLSAIYRFSFSLTRCVTT